MSDKATGATSVDVAPARKVLEPAVLETSSPQALGRNNPVYVTQLALTYVPQTDGLWLCARCRCADYAKDETGLMRCKACGLPRKYAICAHCGNGAQAHTPHGCEGVGEDGLPCECQKAAPA